MAVAYWLRMLHECKATGCRPGDILRIEPNGTRPVYRTRDGVDLEANPGMLARALANGWAEPIPSRLRVASA